MKTILCYGDSNTYGYNPRNGCRYPKNIRWTGVLQELLGDEFLVIEEGCNGRTTVFDDPVDPWKNGLSYLKPCLNTHKPVDMVILMLGSNDLKNMYHASIEMIAEGANRLIQEIQEYADSKQAFRPEILLVAPPVIGEEITSSIFAERFDETAITRSRAFAEYYEKVARKNGCIFFDASKVAESSKLDCLHLMPEAHKKLALGLFEVIKQQKWIPVKTKRLVIRPCNWKEMEQLKELESDIEMKQAYQDMMDCMKENKGQEYWGAAWLIALLDGTRVGDMCFKGAPDEQGEVEIGYGIDEWKQGNGYATEMVAAMIHWALTRPNVKMVTAQTQKNNRKSQRVLKKNGFVPYGYGEEGPRFLFRLEE